MKRTILSLGVTAAVLSLSAMTTLHAESVEPRVAKIMSLSGTAVVERNTHRYTALQGMLLQEGDIVRVLEGGKVNLKYSTCSSNVASTMQVTVSESNQCATGKVANASDLKAPKASVSKIQRIDPNLAEAACNTCKVQLASGVPTGIATGFGSAGKVAAGVLGAGGVASLLGSSGGSSSTAPQGTTPSVTPPVVTPTPVTPPSTGGGGASGVPVSPP